MSVDALAASATTALGGDPLRIYVITLRKLAGLSQEDVSGQLGIGYRTYMAWETGETKDLKLPVARSLIRVIGGSFDHLEHMDELSPEEAKLLAENWAKMSSEEREAARRGRAHLARIIQLAADDPAKLEDVLRRLRDEARGDTELLHIISGFLDGYRAATRRKPD